MSERGSFWSTMPGLVTGAAGLLTALVGLLGLSVQLGWIGGGSSDRADGGTSTSSSSTSSTIRGGTAVPGSSSGTGAAGSGTGSGSGSSSGVAQFVVEPTTVDFTVVGSRQATITVRNTGDLALTVETPTVSGSGAQHFVAGDVSCSKEPPLEPGRSCELQVAFAPKSGGAVSAVAVIATAESPRQTEAQLKGSSLLG